MIKIEDPRDCCGCSACYSICPKEAIEMKPDALGFLYPVVTEDKCINCGLCEKVCAFKEEYDVSNNLTEPIVYAVRHKDMRQIETSRSGAAFIALSDWILEQNGVVYGAGYIGHFRVVHKRAQTKEERDEFKGSKYVQSDMNDVFTMVREDLKSGRLVLFSGTPCQTSGLNSYVGERLRKNLFLVDIVCHGVPSPYIWRDYLKYIEKKERRPINDVNFRDKLKFGWKDHKESFHFLNPDTYTYTYTYTYTFYQHIMFRHSCGVCHFANLKRPSDLTLADYWGWEKTDDKFNADDKGCSLILCNTQKGFELFEKAKKNVNYLSVRIENCMQPNLQHPSEIHPKRMEFEKDYQKRGFLFVARKYMGLKSGWRYQKKRCLNLLRRIKNKMKRMLSQK